ncbi:hypothetical protein cyc_01108 [Cyclospora cayetanensis]|uniref:Uncharacterized protein n=1 Tax=Cyclospora cayetanensis TaxID=88456 RepID=A0A1D3CYL3_9EIME|nr:hypothetical protein cyc_01108 [Cyclospora cayetanensis]
MSPFAALRGSPPAVAAHSPSQGAAETAEEAVFPEESRSAAEASPACLLSPPPNMLYGTVQRKPHAWFCGALFGMQQQQQRLSLQVCREEKRRESGESAYEAGKENCRDSQRSDAAAATTAQQQEEEGLLRNEAEPNRCVGHGSSSDTSSCSSSSSSSSSSDSTTDCKRICHHEDVAPWETVGISPQVLAVAQQEALVLQQVEETICCSPGIVLRLLLAIKQQRHLTWSDCCSSAAAHYVGRLLLRWRAVKRKRSKEAAAAAERRQPSSPQQRRDQGSLGSNPRSLRITSSNTTKHPLSAGEAGGPATARENRRGSTALEADSVAPRAAGKRQRVDIPPP